MEADAAVELGREAVLMSLKLGAPVMVIAIVVGLAISILQAVTQIQDQTISFVPKIIAMLLSIIYFLPWALTQMVDYSTELIRAIPGNL